tara:strand:+ start:1313 stop:1921 length:609 start_codon:yes stop_codon:yes gene_type:complete
LSNLFVDKISGKSGTSSGAPITLSGDTATLGSGVDLSSATIPAAAITGTLGSGVTFPEGHVIQVNTKIDSTTYNNASPSGWTAPGLNSNTITIRQANSIIWMSLNFNWVYRGHDAFANFRFAENINSAGYTSINTSEVSTHISATHNHFHQFAHLEYISQPGFSVGDTYAVQLQFECNSFTMDINNSNSNNRALWVLQEIAG